MAKSEQHTGRAIAVSVSQQVICSRVWEVSPTVTWSVPIPKGESAFFRVFSDGNLANMLFKTSHDKELYFQLLCLYLGKLIL